MKYSVVHHVPGRKATLFFAGWGMDGMPFASMILSGRSTVVTFDYTSAVDPEGEELARVVRRDYDDICVIAWSFGVFYCDRWLRLHSSVPVTFAIAVNGTQWPVDSKRGINPAIYKATLEQLSEESLRKFRLRMCGSRDAFTDFMAVRPARQLDSLRDELCRIQDLAPVEEDTLPDLKVQHMIWDHVFISEYDRIIPAEAQKEAWSGHRAITIIAGGHHLPSWADLCNTIEEMMVDKSLVARRFENAAPTYDSNASVQRRMARHIASLLPDPLPAAVIEAGCGTGLLTRELRRRQGASTSLRLWDLAPLAPDIEQADAEVAVRMLPDESVDLIVSASALQWFQSPLAFLRECHRVIHPGGMVAVATFGCDTYRELCEALGSSSPYPTPEGWGEIASCAGWKDIDMADETYVMEFDSAAGLLRHMRLTGVNALRSGGTAVRDARRLMRILDGAIRPVTLTYQPVYMVLRK